MMTTRRPITGACAWLGPDMARSTRWQRDLAPVDIAALDAALGSVQSRGLAWHEIARETFPLPGMTGLIADIRDELENGSGMMKLRGLPVARYSEDEPASSISASGAMSGPRSSRTAAAS